MSSSPKILRPSPRRPFNYSSAPDQPPSPLLSPSQPDETPSRTHSILNLTSSTLLGIYSPTSYQTDAEFDPPLTPWGTGAETPQMQAVQRASAMLGSPPSRRKTFSSPPPASSTSVAFSLALRSILLFGTGMGYGWLVRHLHNDRQVAPFQVEGIIKPRNDWRYLVFWGVAGVALGSLLPWVDTLFATDEVDTLVKSSVEEDTVEGENSGILGADWTPVVRSVGAFVGIAYAIRKLPWASTMQASLTLALVNPVLWYLIDRSMPGFILSTAVGTTGAALLLFSNPDAMPSPAAFSLLNRNSSVNPTQLLQPALASRDTIEGGIWILSVLFCSCVCFGNIGRRLALSGGKKSPSIPAIEKRGSKRN